MKKQTLIVVALFALIGLTAAGAQAQSSTLVRVSIPFEFKVADIDHPFAAGRTLLFALNFTGPGGEFVQAIKFYSRCLLGVSGS